MFVNFTSESLGKQIYFDETKIDTIYSTSKEGGTTIIYGNKPYKVLEDIYTVGIVILLANKKEAEKIGHGY